MSLQVLAVSFRQQFIAVSGLFMLFLLLDKTFCDRKGKKMCSKCFIIIAVLSIFEQNDHFSIYDFILHAFNLIVNEFYMKAVCRTTIFTLCQK